MAPLNYKHTILCVHGAGGYAHHWSYQLKKAKEWGYRIIAMDLPGHGRSEGVVFTKISDYSQFLEQFLLQSEINHYSLIGHSMGGAIALDMVLRCQCTPKSLILLASSPKLEVNKKILNEFKSGYKPDRFIKMAYDENTSGKLIQTALMEFAKTPSQAYFNDLLACSKFDNSKEIQSIKIPTFWLFGNSDRLISAKDVINSISTMPYSQFKVLENTGHMIHMEQPEAVNKEIFNFLTQLI